MKKRYNMPELSLCEIELNDVILYSNVLPTNNPGDKEIPILTRMRDELSGGDGLSELPSESPEE